MKFLGLAVGVFLVASGGTHASTVSGDGKLFDYVVLRKQAVICKEPVAIGRRLLCSAERATGLKASRIDASGVLDGYMIELDGVIVCRDPPVMESIRTIVCDGKLRRTKSGIYIEMPQTKAPD